MTTRTLPAFALTTTLLLAASSASAQTRTFNLNIVNKTSAPVKIMVTDENRWQGDTGEFDIPAGATQPIWCGGDNRADGGHTWFRVAFKDQRFRGESMKFYFWREGGNLTGPHNDQNQPIERLGHLQFTALVHRRLKTPWVHKSGLTNDHEYDFEIRDPAVIELEGAMAQSEKLVLYAGTPVVLGYKGLDMKLPCRVAVEPRTTSDAKGQHLLVDAQNHGATNGSVPFHGKDLAPGEYEARLYVDYDKATPTVDVRLPFTVVQAPVVEASEAGFQVGQPISIRFRHLPSGGVAVIALAKSGAGPDEFERKMLVDQTDGSLDFPQLPAGSYEARLFLGKGPGGGRKPVASAGVVVGGKPVATAAPVTEPAPVAPKKRPFIEGGLLSPNVDTGGTETTFTFEGTLRDAKGLDATLECTFEIWLPQGGWQTLMAAQGEREYRDDTNGGVKTSVDFKVGNDSYDLSAHNLKIPHLRLLTWKIGKERRLRARAMLLIPGSTPVIAPTTEFTVTF